MSRLCLLCLAAILAAPALPCQRSIPAALVLKGDPAQDMDLGATRSIPFPARKGPRGPVVRAPYLSRSLVEKGEQVVPEGVPGPVIRLMGRDLAVLRPWLSRISKERPEVLSARHWTLASCLEEGGAEIPKPEEGARLRAWFPALSRGFEAGSRLTARQRAHLWASRLCRLSAAVADLLNLTPKGRLQPRGTPYSPLAWARIEVFLFSSRAALDAFTTHIFPSTTWPLDGTTLDSGPVTAVLLAGAPEPTLIRRFNYAVTLQLLRRIRRMPGGLPAWLQVGIAHYMEHRLTRSAGRSRDEAGTLPPGADPPRDRERFVRDLVSAGRSGQIAALTTIPARSLTVRSHLQSWSLVRYLLGLGQPRFTELLNRLLHTPPDTGPRQALIDAVRATYKCDLAVLDRAWKAWVLRRR